MTDDQTQNHEFLADDIRERFAAHEERLAALEDLERAQEPELGTRPSGDFTHTGVALVGRHLPEKHTEVLSAHERQTVELPGTYEIGAVIEGAFIPIARLKAAEVLEAIERAKSSDDEPGDS